MDLKEEKVKENVVQKFRERLKEEDLLSSIKDDAVLMRFLRTRDFNIESAVSTVKSSLQWSKKNAEYLQIPFNESCHLLIQSGLGFVLKKRDIQGRRVVYIKLDTWDPNPNAISLIQLGIGAWYYAEELTLDEEVQRNGLVVVMDWKGVGITKWAYYLSFLTVDLLKIFISFLQGGAPIKLKAAFVIRSPYFFTTFYHAIKYLFKKKTRNRIHFTSGGPKNLKKHLGDNLLDFTDDPDKFWDSVDEEFFKTLYSKNNSCYKRKT